MSLVQDAPLAQSHVQRLMTTDFCPWANRFVYWLKEPIGWFFLATIVSATIGAYFNPIGWTLAGALLAIMFVGMIWPLIAVHAAQCELRPEGSIAVEDSRHTMWFQVRNRLPVPLWGLTVVNYFSREPDIALSSVPPLCTANFRIVVQPKLRGCYPEQVASIACSFPFGIWTARRPLHRVSPLIVWPKVYAINGHCPLNGRDRSQHGDGLRAGGDGDFSGVRPFRRGDSAKHIHWIASERAGSLIVTERAAPQCAEVEVVLDVNEERVEPLAWRVRIAASIVSHMNGQEVPLRVWIGGRGLTMIAGTRGRSRVLNELAAVPHTGRLEELRSSLTESRSASIHIRGTADPMTVCVEVRDPQGDRRRQRSVRTIQIDCRQDVSMQLMNLWQERHHANSAA
jgi:uncharacterized protein (DUF58 family)